MLWEVRKLDGRHPHPQKGFGIFLDLQPQRTWTEDLWWNRQIALSYGIAHEGQAISRQTYQCFVWAIQLSPEITFCPENPQGRIAQPWNKIQGSKSAPFGALKSTNKEHLGAGVALHPSRRARSGEKTLQYQQQVLQGGRSPSGRETSVNQQLVLQRGNRGPFPSWSPPR